VSLESSAVELKLNERSLVELEDGMLTYAQGGALRFVRVPPAGGLRGRGEWR
jgi:hypothetical protein